MSLNINFLTTLLSNNSLKEFFENLKKSINNIDEIKDPILLNLIGIYYLKTKKFNLANKFFDKSISLDPNSFQVLNNKAICLSLIRNFKKSIDTFLASLKVNDSIEETYVAMARCYFSEKKKQKGN